MSDQPEAPGEPDEPGIVVEPEITDAMREQAKGQPGGWLYVVDPYFSGTQDVPGWGVMGAYQVDEAGELAPEFTTNPDYRPSPLVLGLPEPASQLEAAVQLAATGYGDDEQVRAAAKEAEVFLRAVEEGVAIIDEGADRSVVHAFTSEERLPEDWERWLRVPVANLAELLTGRYVVLDPGTPGEVRIPGEELIVAPAT